MGQDNQGKTITTSGVAVTGEHPENGSPTIWVARSTLDKNNENTVNRQILPISCWKIEDICFDFDRAFVNAMAKYAFMDLKELYQTINKKFGSNPKMALFGHADPVGKDDYNKKLSEMRAQAVYAILIKDAAMWQHIFKQRDDIEHLQEKLLASGEDPGPVSGKMQGKTLSAIQSYMEKLCPDFPLSSSDFVEEERHAFQGCSEFNPVVMFSKEEWKNYQKPENKEKRNKANQPNRRVVGFIFKPGKKIKPGSFPCTKYPDIQSCKGQFVKDAEQRRAYQPDKHRTHQTTDDTFACGFYERIAKLSPCEKETIIIKGVKLGFNYTDETLFASTCEETELNEKGEVVAYSKWGLATSYEENKDKASGHVKVNPEKLPEIKRKAALSFEQYLTEERSKATAVIKFRFSTSTGTNGEKLFRVTATIYYQNQIVATEHIEAEKEIDVNGLFYLSPHPTKQDLIIWRKADPGKTEKDFPGKKTKWVSAPKGLDEKVMELYEKLKGNNNANITQRVEKWLIGNR